MISQRNHTSTRAKPDRDVTLPARYRTRWQDDFERRIRAHLRDGTRILDLGSGRRPTVPTAERPPNCFYLGVDISRGELEKAPTGSYDDWIVADAAQFVDSLEGYFDLVVSWQVLEHVKPLQRAIENCRTYLRPGGTFVALFSGTLSAVAVINRLVPQAVGIAAMTHFLARDPETVFPAYYDGTWYRPLRRYFENWESREIVPLFRGADYFSFSRTLQGAYLRYENWAARGNWVNLATHYLVEAVK